MSELKAFELFGNRNGEAIGIDKQNKTLNLNYKEVYLKSEADKVIAELKAQKAQAEDNCVFWKKKYNDCKRELDLLKDTNAFYNGGR